METTQLDTMRAHIISMILRSRKDINESRVVTIEKLRRKHPRI